MGSVTFRKLYFQMQLYSLKPCVSLGCCYTFSSEHLSEGGCEMNRQLLEVTQVPPLTRKYLMKLQAQCLSLSQANVRLTFTTYLIGDPHCLSAVGE